MKTEPRNFDDEAATWDSKPIRVKMANDIFLAMSSQLRLTPQMDVLDFGCGTGLVTVQFSPLVHSITGVDRSKGMLEVLQSKIKDQHLTNVRTQCVDLDKGEALEGRYDLIVSSMTLHHVPDTASLLLLFHKMIAPSGTLCIADLDPDNGQFHADNEGVYHFGFDRSALRKAYEDAGFEDVRDSTAAEILKPNPCGAMRRFTVFLLTGRRVCRK